MNTKDQLKQIIKKAINSEKEISVKWDCGGDQAIITVYIDGTELNYDNAFAQEMDMYLINKLDLPDVGEFAMEGGGKIIMEQENIYIEYESRWKGYEDFDEEFNPLGWKEVDEIDETNSGKTKLFDEIN